MLAALTHIELAALLDPLLHRLVTIVIDLGGHLLGQRFELHRPSGILPLEDLLARLDGGFSFVFGHHCCCSKMQRTKNEQIEMGGSARKRLIKDALTGSASAKYLRRGREDGGLRERSRELPTTYRDYLIVGY